MLGQGIKLEVTRFLRANGLSMQEINTFFSNLGDTLNRAEIATRLLQGMLSNPYFLSSEFMQFMRKKDYANHSQAALVETDELIQELNKGLDKDYPTFKKYTIPPDVLSYIRDSHKAFVCRDESREVISKLGQRATMLLRLLDEEIEL